MFLISDLHNHVSFTSASEMVRAAKSSGLRIFGLSEHISQLTEARPILEHMPQEGPFQTFAEYRAQVLSAAQAEGLDVRLGLEVDYYPGKNEAIQAALLPYSWDFLIGSIHDVDALHYDRYEDDFGKERGEALWLRYFELLREAVKSGFFQVISHPVRMYKTNHYLPPTFDAELERLAAEATAYDVALEINGFDVITYPHMVRRVMQACAAQHTPISYGSDAHFPKEVGVPVQAAADILRAAGITQLRTWKNQQVEEYTL